MRNRLLQFVVLVIILSLVFYVCSCSKASPITPPIEPKKEEPVVAPPKEEPKIQFIRIEATDSIGRIEYSPVITVQ